LTLRPTCGNVPTESSCALTPAAFHQGAALGPARPTFEEAGKMSCGVLTPEKIGEKVEDWQARALDALREEGHGEGHGEGAKWVTDLRPVTVEPVIAADGRCVGLTVDGEADDPKPYTLWLSPAEARRLGQALVKQAASTIVATAEEDLMLLSPMGLAIGQEVVRAK